MLRPETTEAAAIRRKRKIVVDILPPRRRQRDPKDAPNAGPPTPIKKKEWDESEDVSFHRNILLLVCVTDRQDSHTPSHSQSSFLRRGHDNRQAGRQNNTTITVSTILAKKVIGSHLGFGIDTCGLR